MLFPLALFSLLLASTFPFLLDFRFLLFTCLPLPSHTKIILDHSDALDIGLYLREPLASLVPIPGADVPRDW
jgi:hypothetical protein